MDERTVQQLAQANEKLKENIPKTILTANKVKNLYACIKSKVLLCKINKIMLDRQ